MIEVSIDVQTLSDEELTSLIGTLQAEISRREDLKHEMETDKARGKAERLAAFAQRARSLMGNRHPNFEVKVWCRDGDKRVYVGIGTDPNWIEYYHTGTLRFPPGTLKIDRSQILKDLAQHHGCSVDEATSMITSFCIDMCNKYQVVTLRVTEDNAPRDEDCHVSLGWGIRAGKAWLRRGKFYAWETSNSVEEASLLPSKDDADKARDEAYQVLWDKKVPGKGGTPIFAPGTLEPSEVQGWLAFPPK